MKIEIKKNTKEVVLELEGRLDTTTAPMLDQAIHEEMGDAKHLVLDMKELAYISSAGLRVLLSAQKMLQKSWYSGSMTAPPNIISGSSAGVGFPEMHPVFTETVPLHPIILHSGISPLMAFRLILFSTEKIVICT